VGLIICSPVLAEAPLFAGFMAPSSTEYSLTGSQVFKRAESLVFKISTKPKGARSDSSHGTGFVVQKSGLLVTNFHVVSQYLTDLQTYDLFVESPQGPLPAKVVAVDGVNDLAVIRVPATFQNVLPLSDGNLPQQGESLFSVGFPKSEGLSIITGLWNSESLMGFAPVGSASMPLNPGMSGGPAINLQGKVIGVNRAIQSASQNLSYVSPLRALRAIVNKAKSQRNVASVDLSWKTEIVQQVLRQEALALRKMASVSASTQKVGPFRFRLPLGEQKCGQDKDFLFCGTVGLSLIDSDKPSLSIKTAIQHGSHPNSFRELREDYRRFSKKERREEGLEPFCQVKNVRNKNGVILLVRACSKDIHGFQGLQTTFVKVDTMPNRGPAASFTQVYQGLSSKAIALLLEKFLDSIRFEARP